MAASKRRAKAPAAPEADRGAQEKTFTFRSRAGESITLRAETWYAARARAAIALLSCPGELEDDAGAREATR